MNPSNFESGKESILIGIWTPETLYLLKFIYQIFHREPHMQQLQSHQNLLLVLKDHQVEMKNKTPRMPRNFLKKNKNVILDHTTFLKYLILFR